MTDIWIQIENRPWDICPHNIDRMTGQTIQQVEGASSPAPVSVTLKSINGGADRHVTMFKPLRDGAGDIVDALILRRYKPPAKADQSDAWTVPDDRKVNPWDINELDPSEKGTMGTIPGPTIEANVDGSDLIKVHFRNLDNRLTKDGMPMAIEHRCHSLHPHGVVFETTSDGAYPLSPPDPTQAVGGEAALWALVPGGGVSQFKKGDRVPPGATFTYTWKTVGWPTTAGVWLYHDHSICDDDNIGLGAIGFIVIHNPADVDQEVDPRNPADPSQLDPAFLPGGSPTGSPIFFPFVPIALEPSVRLLPHQLENLISPDALPHDHVDAHTTAARGAKKHAAADKRPTLFKHGDLLFGVDDKFTVGSFLFARYRTPPTKLLVLQLFHALQNGATCINGRQYLGNTPTILAGTATRMRFGVVGMGSDFHTFHLHGHRWTIPGPDGTTPNAIQGSAQVRAVSQFEDTRTFGPANSFVFTINGASGSFMRAGGISPALALGEWHMHCHVLMHMMGGMMGSMLIVNGGEFATPLPRGVPCPSSDTPAPGAVTLKNFAFNPQTINIHVGDSVQWVWQEDMHSVTSDNNSWPDTGVQNTGFTFQHMFMSSGTFVYHCSVHGAVGKIGMWGQVVVT